MTGITMFDAIDDTQFPAGAAAYAAYVDGDLADQPNYSFIVRAFPDAEHLSITLDPSKRAMALDVETGAATPADIPTWYARQRVAGVARPCVYANASTMEAGVIVVLSARQIPRASVRLWSAHYTEEPHICGPASCGATSIDMDGTQWTEHALGRDLDQSLLLDDFFGSQPAPPLPEWEIDMGLPTVQAGSTGPIVKSIQGLCAARGHATAIDGSYGNLTMQAVKSCQQAAGVAMDGICGPVTWVVLITGAKP